MNSSGRYQQRYRAVTGWPASSWWRSALDAGDSEATEEFNLSNILDNRIEGLGDAVRIDVGEEIRWLDGVVSNTRSGEVVRGGN